MINTGAEFSSTLWNVSLAEWSANDANPASVNVNIITPGVTIGNMLSTDSTSQLTIRADLTVDGDVAVTAGGKVTLAAGRTLTLMGSSNELGNISDFSAGLGSTVNYAANIAQTVDAVNYYNLTISGTGIKTAAAGFNIGVNNVGGDLAVNNGSQLTLNLAASDIVNVYGNTAVAGTLAFTSTGTLALYGDNNNLGTFSRGQSTVAYLGGANQPIYAVDYYNLEVGGGVARKIVNFDLTVYNNFTIDANTTFRLGANTLQVNNNFTVLANGDFQFTGDGFLRLGGAVTSAFSFNLTTGTVVYQGAATQQVAAGTYYNLAIDNGDKMLDRVVANQVTVNDNFIFESMAGRLLIGGNLNRITLNGGVVNASGPGGRYFANTVTANSGEVYFALAAGQVRSLTIGTLTQWSTLSFTGSEVDQQISIWTKDGITPAIPSRPIPNPYAANMTFMVTMHTAGTTFSMDMMGTNSGDANFVPLTSVPFFYASSGWTQVANPLYQDGSFFFGFGMPETGLIVTNTKDSGSGSLRWAVAAANQLDGVNLITFDKNVFRTQQNITLTSGEILITDSVIIKGLGTTLITVDGNNQSPIFDVASIASVSISGLTITKGSTAGSGGAITVNGILQLENVEISDSHAAVNGGAIYVADTGKLYTMKVTITGSQAGGLGNGVYSDGVLSLYNSTIAYNGAGGADMYLDNGSARLFNVTVAADSAGTAIGNSGTALLSMYNTLVYGVVNGPYSGNHNFITTDSSIFVNGILADNGGWVRTIAIANDSRVVNQGLGYKDGAYQYDSRGYLINGANDLGAFEYKGYVARNTTATSDAYSSTLSDAIAKSSTGDKIELVDTRIKLDSEIVITKDITLLGSGEWTTVLAAADNSRAFSIGLASIKPAVNMIGFAIRDGVTAGNGGAIYNTGNLQLREILIAHNTAGNSGGAVYNASGAFLYVNRSALIDNNAAVDGGAIYNLGSITVNVSQLSSNSAARDGGSIYNGILSQKNGQLFLFNSTADYNTAGGAGGAIYTLGKFQAETSTIAYNSAVTFGGGIYSTGDSRLNGLTVAYNMADGAGGGIYLNGGVISLVNTLAVYNRHENSWNDLTITSGTQGLAKANFIGDLVSGFYASGDLVFDGSLKDNGGWVYTLALNSASSYFSQISGHGIEVGNAFDQRGYLLNGNRDIGAYEYDGNIGWYYTSSNSKILF